MSNINAFNKYSSKVKSKGQTLRDRYKNDAENFINDKFEDSPTFREIELFEKGENIGIFDVRVNKIERMGNIRNLLFRPNTNVDVGNMTKFEDRVWLLYDKFGSRFEHVTITAIRTNHNLKWIDADDILHTNRCYASSSDLGSKSKQSRATIEYNKYDVKLPYGQLYIFIETTEDTRRIDLQHRFIVNGIPYSIVGIDNTTLVEDDYGIIQFTVKRTTAVPEDDLENDIAYNVYSFSERNESMSIMRTGKLDSGVDINVDEKGGGLI